MALITNYIRADINNGIERSRDTQTVRASSGVTSAVSDKCDKYGETSRIFNKCATLTQAFRPAVK